MSSINYSEYHYGKGSVKVAKVVKQPSGVHEFREYSVDIQLYGEQLLDSFTAPTNRLVVPTDTIKNTVYILAKKFPMNNPVEFALDISSHFLQKYAHIAKAHVEIHEAVWRRIVQADGAEHTHGFVDKSSYRNWCSVFGDRLSVQLEAGILELEILKTKGSSFVDFWKDEYTVLQPARDRIMSTKANLKWTYDSFYDLKAIDHGAMYAKVKQLFSDQFAKHDESESVQHTIDIIGNFILHEIKELSAIDMNLPNVHYLLFNLKQFGMENDNEIFTPTTEPYGNIYAKLSKTEHAVEFLNSVSKEHAHQVLKDIFHNEKFVSKLVSRRPYESFDHLFKQFDQILPGLDSNEILTGISSLPRIDEFINQNKQSLIGEDNVSRKFHVINEIQQLNKYYEAKFQHKFVLATSGKSVDDILDSLKNRIDNENANELKISVSEFKKIILSKVPEALNAAARSPMPIKVVKLSEGKNHGYPTPVISSHVLDLNTGKPAEGLRARLFKLGGFSNEWLSVGEGVTNSDGRISNLLNGSSLESGLHKIVFFAGEFFDRKNVETFYPEVEIKFEIKDHTSKYHIPLLLNQYGFSTYRGS
jgi:urate oxidase